MRNNDMVSALMHWFELQASSQGVILPRESDGVSHEILSISMHNNLIFLEYEYFIEI